jgi:hypothetical protein
MVIQNKDDLNLILQLPKKNNIIVGKLKLNSKKINFEKRIALLYMESIGFVPHMQGKDYVVYEAKSYYTGKVEVIKKYKQGSSASYREEVDITDAEFLTVDNLLDGFTFVLSNYDGEAVDINKYTITKMDQENFSIDGIDNLHLSFKDKNLVINRNNEDVSLEDTKTFFEGVYHWQGNVFDNIEALIFDSFVDEKGFLDIYEKYKEFVCDEPSCSYYDAFRYYYYVGQLDFYFLAEYFIKNDLKELKKHNPIFTNKPIEKISDIPMLSKLGMEVYKKYNFSESEDVLFKMEADPKIGTSGLKIIYETIDLINKVKAGYNSIFYTGNERYLFKEIYFILKKFDITPKNLMDRLVRSMFNEHVSIDRYTGIIVDYVKMGESLNVEIDKKIPADVVRLHDLFSDQIQYIKDAEIEAAFAETIIENNKLLASLPASNDFTIVSPQDPGDLIHEGLILNHCVGSYIDRYASGYSKIFFVRRKAMADQPFVTIELDRNNNIVQMSARANQTPNGAVVDFVNSWISKIK